MAYVQWYWECLGVVVVVVTGNIYNQLARDWAIKIGDSVPEIISSLLRVFMCERPFSRSINSHFL